MSKDNDLRGILGRPSGDFLFRYPTFWLPDDHEFLFQRFQWMVSASVDSNTSISTIEVNAFTADDAQALATAMLEYAEGLVNQMNQRTFDDSLAAANRFVADAQKEFDDVEAELKAYRNASGSIDPAAISQSKLTVIEALSTQLAQIVYAGRVLERDPRARAVSGHCSSPICPVVVPRSSALLLLPHQLAQARQAQAGIGALAM